MSISANLNKKKALLGFLSPSLDGRGLLLGPFECVIMPGFTMRQISTNALDG
jgi:hypothetical protein